MTTLGHHRHLLRWNDWANRTALDSVADAIAAPGPPPERALTVMAHIVGAERLWHGRLVRAAAPAEVWPDLDVPGIRAGLDDLRDRWTAYLDRLAADGTPLGTTIAYVNSRGEPWTSAIDDVLTHVVMHSSYHRGQVATQLAAHGHPPAYTDYIHATRGGLL